MHATDWNMYDAVLYLGFTTEQVSVRDLNKYAADITNCHGREIWNEQPCVMRFQTKFF